MTGQAELVEGTLAGEIQEIMGTVFRGLIECDKAYEFVAAMRKRAELVTRNFPQIPVANRDMAMGQISICYELADGAKAALEAAISEAKEKAAARTRKEAAAQT